ncbi:DMT family transporter [Halotalea alkalilenta]|uniref:Guanidinium exporter n=1 Tax=Halotalea alkalilenta TaxID=376489 RepID=A0A172YCY7_9GAMM|nr:multidrug efflux SMR transporter [Halotalea alkalilenta]ANF57074.1 small multidrug resistance protein [Halotalea alkalilenta]
MAWLILIFAGLLEVVGVTAIKRVTDGHWRSGLAVIVVGFSASLALLNLAMREIDLGVAYATFTGIGAVGSALLGMWLWGESHRPLRIAFLALIVCAVVGLKLVD